MFLLSRAPSKCVRSLEAPRHASAFVPRSPTASKCVRSSRRFPSALSTPFSTRHSPSERTHANTHASHTTHLGGGGEGARYLHKTYGSAQTLTDLTQRIDQSRISLDLARRLYVALAASPLSGLHWPLGDWITWGLGTARRRRGSSGVGRVFRRPTPAHKSVIPKLALHLVCCPLKITMQNGHCPNICDEPLLNIWPSVTDADARCVPVPVAAVGTAGEAREESFMKNLCLTGEPSGAVFARRSLPSSSSLADVGADEEGDASRVGGVASPGRRRIWMRFSALGWARPTFSSVPLLRHRSMVVLVTYCCRFNGKARWLASLLRRRPRSPPPCPAPIALSFVKLLLRGRLFCRNTGGFALVVFAATTPAAVAGVASSSSAATASTVSAGGPIDGRCRRTAAGTEGFRGGFRAVVRLLTPSPGGCG